MMNLNGVRKAPDGIYLDSVRHLRCLADEARSLFNEPDGVEMPSKRRAHLPWSHDEGSQRAALGGLPTICRPMEASAAILPTSRQHLNSASHKHSTDLPVTRCHGPVRIPVASREAGSNHPFHRTAGPPGHR